MKINLITILILFSVNAISQPFAEALEQIQATVKLKIPAEKAKCFDKAEQILLKAYLKDSLHPLINYALCQLYGNDDFSRKDYFKAWNHFVKANNQINKIKTDDYEYVKAYYQIVNSRRRNKTPEENFAIEKAELEDKLIRFVREENNYDLAVRFLNEFPDSKFTQNVIHIRNYLAFRKVEKSSSIDEYNQFSAGYPDAAQIPQAIRQRDELAFKKVKEINTLDAYNDYLNKYPESFYANDVKKLRNQVAFEKASQQNSLESIDQFLNNYPDAIEVPKARIIKRNLLFERAKQINSIEAYNDFILKYPEGDQYVDVFNLKASAIGNKILQQSENLPFEWIKGFDNNQGKDEAACMANQKQYLLVAGNSYRDDKLKTDAWLIWLKPDGKMVKNRFLGENGYDKPDDVIITSKGDAVFCGILGASSDTANDGKAWMFSVSADNAVNWSRTFKTDRLQKLAYSDPNIVAGGYQSDTSGNIYPYLVKTNMEGKKIWERAYSKKGKIKSLLAKDDGKILFSTGNWIGMLDNDGYLVWDMMIADSLTIDFIMANQTGNIIFVGNSQFNLYFRESDLTGKIISENFIPVPANQKTLQVAQSENNILVCTSDQDNNLHIFELTGNELKPQTSIRNVKYKHFNKFINIIAGTKYLLFGLDDIILIKAK